MKKLLSGNEALALGAYHAGVAVAAAYPGTPSTEILEHLARLKDIYTEWSTNEKVAMEVGLGAAYAGVRALVCMKQVGLNVASDPFMAASTTGIDGGMVVIAADDPGAHSTQGEQDSRHYAKMAKVPVLEPSDSQEAYDLMLCAFDISEQFDTPVMLRSTTRVSHSNSLMEIRRERTKPKQAAFKHDVQKYVMLPVYARIRRPLLEERLVKLAIFAETFLYNKIIKGDTKLGIVSSGVAYQYAREVFPKASFLKLGMTYPLPQDLIRKFAKSVDKLLVVEELDPFLEEHIRALGINVIGKEFIPKYGEMSLRVMEDAGRRAGLLPAALKSQPLEVMQGLPGRPPLLCPGCPHTGMFFVLSTLGQRAKLLDASGKAKGESKMIITGDIGCYTLGAYPPLRALDTTACMGASIGEALGMEKAGVAQKVVAVIGDSTFLHSGITGVVDAVYNGSQVTIIILDNGTTAMTGHQHHPGTGISVQGKVTRSVDIEKLVKGIGVSDVKVVDAFDMKALRAAMRSSLDTPDLSVVIVRGICAMLQKKRTRPRTIDIALCDNCGICIKVGCPAIQKLDDQVFIDATLCVGDACTVCQQLCPKKAIGPVSAVSGESK